MIEFGYRPDLLKGRLGNILDHVRWIAALAVCAAHLRNLLMPDKPKLGVLSGLFYFFTLFGTQAVIVFFVVSGLLVGGAIIRMMEQKRFPVGSYAVDRGTRLYIVLIPAILLSLAFQPAGLTMTCHAPETWQTIAGNAVFLQNFATTPLCNNHPLWSLSSEAFFYLIVPALALFVLRQSVLAGVVSALLTALCVWFWKTDHFEPVFGLVLWLCGLAPWFVRIKLPAIVPAALCALALVASRSHHIANPFADDLIVAFTFTATLCATFPADRKPAGWGTAFAGFSYSLYLVHMPLAQAIASRLSAQMPPSKPMSYVVYFASLGAIVLVAWVFGWLFEARTGTVRNWVRDRVVPVKPVPPAAGQEARAGA